MTEPVQDAPGTTTDTGTTDATQSAQQSLPLDAGQQSTQATAGADTTAQAEDNTAETPIEYQPFAMPEGIKADEEVLGEFVAEAKRLKLSQEDAQKVANIGAKMQLKQAEAYRKTQEAWRESTRTDSEIGGEAFQENIAIANKAFSMFATPQLTQVLKDTGLGLHPEVVRAFYRVGKAISEDNRVITGDRPGAVKDPARRLFPNQV